MSARQYKRDYQIECSYDGKVWMPGYTGFASFYRVVVNGEIIQEGIIEMDEIERSQND